MEKKEVKIKFNYYQIFEVIRETIRRKTVVKEKILFDFGRVIEKIKGKECQILTIGELKLRLEEMSYDEDKDLWCIRFSRVTEEGIAKIKEGEEIKALELNDDEYIGYDLFIMAERKTGILMIQNNKRAFNINKIKSIICELLKENLSKESTIEIEPIIDKNLNNKISNCYQKTLEFSLANLNLWVDEGEKTPFSDILRFFKTYDGARARVKISLGHSKIKTLNIGNTTKLIEEIKINEKYVNDARVSIKEDDSDIEVIDIFDNFFHDILTFNIERRNILKYQTVKWSMSKKYIERREAIYRAINYIYD